MPPPRGLTPEQPFGIVGRVKRLRRLRYLLVAAVTVIGATSPQSQALDRAIDAARPIPVRDLPSDPTWYAHVIGGSGNWGPAFADNKVYVGTNVGVTAYPRRCQGVCASLWHSALPDEFDGYQVAGGDGHVAAASRNGLYVFDGTCAADGSKCQPLWTAGGDPFWVGIVGSSVVVTESAGSDDRVSVYPLDCTDPCSPTWSRVLRTGARISPSVVLHDVLYTRGNHVLFGVSMACATGAGRCSVAFRAGHLRYPALPVATPRRVIFGTGHGPDGSELAAYPAGCGHGCSPVWRGDASGYVELAPMVAGGMVFTASIGHIDAFPIQCGDPCSPVWTAHAAGYPIVEYADAERVIGISHFGTRAVYAFPTACAANCQAAWTHAYSDRSRMPLGTLGDGRHIFVAFPDHLIAYKLVTGRNSWHGKLHHGEGWWLDEGPRSLLAYVRNGLPDEGGKLDAFFAQ
jgi:hypothetical protein